MSNDITKQDDKFDNPFGEYLTDTLNIEIEGGIQSSQLTTVSGTSITSGGLLSTLTLTKNGKIQILDDNGLVRVLIGAE